MSKARQFLDVAADHVLDLKSQRGLPEQSHVFTEPSIHAVNAALAASRPLLVRGEPGVGKSQLAQAVAEALEWAFVPFVVDSRTESRDLLWRFDAVARLAKAQLAAACHAAWSDEQRRRISTPEDTLPGGEIIVAGETISEGPQGPLTQLETRLTDWLHERRFVHPGPLWWAFDWEDAKAQAALVGGIEPPQLNPDDHQRGCVVLVDEIDKAEPDLPNGLLEALGDRRFKPVGRNQAIEVTGPSPLVIITTNEERTLPDAFLRRCLVLPLALPDEVKEADEFIAVLRLRGEAHFNRRGKGRPKVTKKILTKAAELVAQDRHEARTKHLSPLPGQAEFLDLVRAVDARRPGDEAGQSTLLDQISSFVLKKQAENSP